MNLELLPDRYYFEFEEDFLRIFKIIGSLKSMSKIWIWYREACETKSDKPLMLSVETVTFIKNMQSVYIENYVNNDKEKRVDFKLDNVVPLNLSMGYSYGFYPNTSNDKVVYVYKSTIKDEFNLLLTKEHNNSTTKLTTFHMVSKAFRKCLNGLNQIESVFIKGSFDSMWSLLLDLNKLIEITNSKFLGSSINYSSSSVSVGTLMELTFSNDIKIKLRIKKVKMTKFSKLYILESVDSNSYIPLQEIQFLLIKSKKGFFLEFKHIFKQYVKLKIIRSYSCQKQQMLANLKRHFENEKFLKKK